MDNNRIRIGIDFDGVLAYNPFRIVRAPIAFVKKTVLGERKTKFIIPSSPVEMLVWKVVFGSSVFPAVGVSTLQRQAVTGKYDFFLVTARFDFLTPFLHRWLDNRNLRSVFKEIYTNDKNEQPHLYKERTIKKLHLDYFIEDNWDVVSHLNKQVNTKVLWIYNITDRHISYPHKYPYLEKALKAIEV